jgi:non-ribosomal peptide synthase protein (TIGR01720 family)
VEVSLSEEETRALLEEIPAVHRTQVTDLLLTALAQAVTAWTGGSSARLELEGSARTASVLGADLSRTVGACGFFYPVQLSLEGTASPAGALRAVKEQLRQVPEHGLGYSLLASGAGPDGAAERLRALPRAPILITYRPQLAAADDAPFRLAGEPLAPTGEERRPQSLVVTAGVAAGRVSVSFESREGLHRRATIEGLAARFAAALRELIAECRSGAAALTPSDFPDAELDQGDLDRLFGS